MADEEYQQYNNHVAVFSKLTSVFSSLTPKAWRQVKISTIFERMGYKNNQRLSVLSQDDDLKKFLDELTVSNMQLTVDNSANALIVMIMSVTSSLKPAQSFQFSASVDHSDRTLLMGRKRQSSDGDMLLDRIVLRIKLEQFIATGSFRQKDFDYGEFSHDATLCGTLDTALETLTIEEGVTVCGGKTGKVNVFIWEDFATIHPENSPLIELVVKINSSTDGDFADKVLNLLHKIGPVPPSLVGLVRGTRFPSTSNVELRMCLPLRIDVYNGQWQEYDIDLLFPEHTTFHIAGVDYALHSIKFCRYDSAFTANATAMNETLNMYLLEQSPAIHIDTYIKEISLRQVLKRFFNKTAEEFSPDEYQYAQIDFDHIISSLHTVRFNCIHTDQEGFSIESAQTSFNIREGFTPLYPHVIVNKLEIVLSSGKAVCKYTCTNHVDVEIGSIRYPNDYYWNSPDKTQDLLGYILRYFVAYGIASNKQIRDLLQSIQIQPAMLKVRIEKHLNVMELYSPTSMWSLTAKLSTLELLQFQYDHNVYDVNEMFSRSIGEIPLELAQSGRFVDVEVQTCS